MQDTIALICDCDQTLAYDTTSLLLEKNNIDKKLFWNDVLKMVEDGWDPPQAWMDKIIHLMNDNRIEQNTLQKLHNLGNEIRLYDGVSTLASEIQQEINNNQDYVNAGISIKFFIVSQGIEDLIKGCDGLSAFEIFGSRFEERKDKISTIKSTVTFTEKTKFLFAINKGISYEQLRKKPYLVNQTIDEDNRIIPFENMIYLGDSENDIPCFSMLNKMKGGKHTISIDPIDQSRKGFQLTRGNRTRYGPYTSDYRNTSELRKAISYAINSIADNIVLEKKKN